MANLLLPMMRIIHGYLGHMSAVSKIKHHDVNSSRIFAGEIHDKGPQEWTKQALKTSPDATESNQVEVIAKSHFQKQPISSRFSSCQLLWQGKKVGYS